MPTGDDEFSRFLPPGVKVPDELATVGAGRSLDPVLVELVGGEEAARRLVRKFLDKFIEAAVKKIAERMGAKAAEALISKQAPPAAEREAEIAETTRDDSSDEAVVRSAARVAADCAEAALQDALSVAEDEVRRSCGDLADAKEIASRTRQVAVKSIRDANMQ